MVGLYTVIQEMSSFPMSVANNFCDLWLSKYLDSKTVLIYCPHPVLCFDTGKGGGRVEPERILEGHQFTKLGRKYQHDLLFLQSINSDTHATNSLYRSNVIL